MVVKSVIVLGMAAVLLSACAVTGRAPVVAAPTQSIAAMLAAADDAARQGQADKANGLLQAAAAAYPAEKEPWLRLAQRGLDARHYRDALNHALEVLARDGDDRAAHAIAVVSAARLAGASAAQLSRGPAWSGAQRSDAQEAARQLLASLNESANRGSAALRPAPAPLPAMPAPPGGKAAVRLPSGPDLTPLQKLEELKKNARTIPVN